MPELFWMTVGRLLARDRSPARRKATWRVKVVRLTGVLLIALALYGVYAVPRIETLHVQTVLVEGTQRLTEQEIIDATGLVGRSILAVRSVPVEAQLERMPYVASAKVEHGWSGTVRVLVEERTPRLVVASNNRMFLLDATGVVLEPVAGRSGFPVLEVESDALPQLGQKLAGDHVEYALRLFSELPPEVRDVAGKLSYRTELGYELTSTAGWTAILGDDTQLGVKAATLQQVVARKNVTLVDVSSPANPYYRKGKR